MKVDLIKASSPGPFKDYKRYMGAPPQSIFSVAACTPGEVELTLTDETADMPIDYQSDSELVAVFMSTPDAYRAYSIAERLRDDNKTVVLGGLHASALPNESTQHADSVMIGEVEAIWPQLLEDFKRGCLQQQYQRKRPVDLSTLRPYPRGYIDPAQYHGYWSVLVGRGCPNRCSYCVVGPFFRETRFRPIDLVVEEIRQCETDRIELHADNLIADRDYALALFEALKPLKIRWSGEATLDIASDEGLLAAARESGLEYLLVGLETPSRSALVGAGKGFVRVEEVAAQIAQLHDYQVTVDSAFLFGFDQHDASIFEETIAFVKEIGLRSTHSVVLIPFPGTLLFEKLERAGRITTRDWSLYDGTHAVFQPKRMSRKELEEGAWWFHQRLTELGIDRVEYQQPRAFARGFERLRSTLRRSTNS